MAARDFLILMLCNVLWAGNLAVSAWALGHHDVPPFMLASLRALIVMLIMTPFLFKPKPENFIRLILVCLCVGPLHLGFLYTGLQTASATGSGVVSQMLIPFAAILSIAFLKERPGWITIFAIIGAFIGSVIMIYEPGQVDLDIGLIYVGAAYLALAAGSVLIRTVGAVDWRIYVAWVAVTVLPTMVMMSMIFEPSPQDIWGQSKWPLMIAAVYAALCVSIVAHGQYFSLLQRYTVNRVVPLTLMTPVFAAILGITFLGDAPSKRLLVGALFILPCVYIIASNKTFKVTETRNGECK